MMARLLNRLTLWWLLRGLYRHHAGDRFWR